uniref:Uncharacterized protein n=1 Tax=Acrobeloides nanus TaxID=290746 RepID=A0A914E872_9BILA
MPLRHGVAFRDLQEVLDAMEFHGWIGVQTLHGYGPDMYCNPDQCIQLERIKAMGHFIEIPSNDDARLAAELLKGYRVGFDALTIDLAPYDISIYDEREAWPYARRRFLFIRDMKLSYEMLAFAMNP